MARGEIFRWIAMPFAAFLGAGIGSMIIPWLIWLYHKYWIGYSEKGGCFLSVLPLFSHALFGWLFVIITCQVAPRGKLISGVVMTTILGGACLLQVVGEWQRSGETTGEKIWSTILVSVAVVSAIITLAQNEDSTRLN